MTEVCVSMAAIRNVFVGTHSLTPPPYSTLRFGLHVSQCGYSEDKHYRSYLIVVMDGTLHVIKLVAKSTPLQPIPHSAHHLTLHPHTLCVNATVWVDAVLDTYWKEYVM